MPAGKPSRYVASYPGQLSLAIPSWVRAMSSSLWGEGLVWPGGAMVCLHAALRLIANGGWPHNVLKYHQLMTIWLLY